MKNFEWIRKKNSFLCATKCPPGGAEWEPSCPLCLTATVLPASGQCLLGFDFRVQAASGSWFPALWELPARTSLQASCLSSCPLPPRSPEPWCFSLPGRVSASVAASLLLQPGGAGGADGLRGSLAVCSERSVDLLSSPCIENSLLKTWWAYFYGPLPTAESIVIRWDFLAILFHFRVILNQAWVNIYDFSRNVADLWHGN